ncbi:Pr6Pr family membrane protein [Cryobacterium sp. MLB-32]|uniref:Pr6Pr family membrane protein n=1 Tax=Cryobacterium sp. MLB-32 TaxID=1529318 RepID=UPI0012E07C27|nr:Pr6Pr family membrane protein [Cryobacterium sp. MLB-32]
MSPSVNLPDSTPARRIVGVIRLAMALLLVAAVATQIVDESVHDSFVPAEYFSYFTIQSAVIVAVVLAFAGAVSMRRRRDSDLLTSLRLAALCYAVVTGVVYAALLRGVATDGYAGIAWPNEALHVWAPIVVAVDWLVAPGRSRPAWGRLWATLYFPIAWLSFTLIRGAVTGWYPYPFLDPASAAGWTGVLLYIAAIAVFITGTGAVGIAAARLATRGRGDVSDLGRHGAV